MGRVGGRTALKCSNNRHVRMKNMDSEDSDEDYVAEVDDISDELDSFVGDASEEDSCFEEDDNEEEEEKEEEDDNEEEEEKEEEDEYLEEEEEEVEGDDDDEEEEEGEEGEEGEDDDEEEEEEWKTVVKPKGPKRSVRSRQKNGIKKTRKKRRKVVYSDSDDDDDEEFTPDEIDSLEEEEEEFSSPKRKTKKRKRTTVRRKSSGRRRRRKTRANASRKSVRKKSKKTVSSRRKSDSGDDEDFTESGPTLRGRGKKKPLPRKKRVKSGSDSEFCSDPSDYEFTISEEEREQIREANDFCRRLAPSLRSSSKRVQEDEVVCEVRKPPARKGKEKADEKKTDVCKPVCGICLSEEGKSSIRGTLNCCNHYFCFACIMEWSKVESRCPLCKQRFISISKPSRCVKGFGLRDSIIQIPERDQVYQPSEEELRDFLNPYENVICTECHHGGDDDLMLLCDVCDSPAHTYCVGLGREVPDGNWYCDGCRPVALASSQSLPQDLTPDRRTNVHSPYGSSAYENMSEIDLNVTIPETPVSQTNGFFPSPRYAGGSFQPSTPVSGTGVSTVFGRRRIQNQIRALLSSRLATTPTGAHLDPLRSLLGVDSTFQQGRTTDVGSSHHAVHGDTLQDNPFYDVQNRSFISERTNHVVGQVGQASTSNGSANTQMQWNGVERMNFGASQSQISGDEQLRRCTSQPNVGFEIGTSLMNHQGEDHNSLVKQRVHSIVNSQLLNISRDLNLSQSDHRTILGAAIDAIMVAFERESPRLGIHHEHEPRPCCDHVGLWNVELSPMSECCLSCFENFAIHTLKKMMNVVRSGPPYWWRLRY